MSAIDPLSRFPFPSSWRKPLFVIIVGAGMLAFILWTLPNWAVFWSHVSQFSSLWHIPTNRRIIIYLLIKITSPLLIMGILATIVWIYSLMLSSQDAEETAPVSFAHVQYSVDERDENSSTAHLMQKQQLQAHVVSPPSPPYPLPASVPPNDTAETSPPSTVLRREPMEGPIEPFHSPTFLVQDEQSGRLTDQGSENTTTDHQRSGASSLQLATLSHPGTFAHAYHAASDEPRISLHLLKDVSMVVNIPGGGHVVVPLTLNAKRVQLLAYIAWRRGELIARDKILEQVFGWGLSDEEATEDKLAQRFESHKKLLRRKVREVIIERINTPAGRQVLPPDLDPFMSNAGFWGLSEQCRVDDLEVIETQYKVIALARKDGKLIDEIPEHVKEACEQVIAHYSGDFLESLIKKYPGEFRSWQGRSSWVRKPYTLYRDYYLDALWYAAEYEWRMGQHATESGSAKKDEGILHKQQEHFGRAAQKYQSYAMYACNSKVDTKATFGLHGEFGERVGMSERALRRCVVLLGAIGRTDLVNQVWSAYYTQMRSISDQRWQPSQETQADVQAARAQTSAYRFAAQVSQMSSAFAEKQERVS